MALWSRNKKAVEKEMETKPGKNQPSINAGRGTLADFLSPSVIKETKPGEPGEDDYWVKIGGTTTDTRIFRSFFSELAASNTWAGILDPLAKAEFGDADLDLIIHAKPADTNRAMWDLNREINGIESDLATEKNSSKRADLVQELMDKKEQRARLRTNIERLFFVSIQAIASGTDIEMLRRFCNAMVARFSGQGIYLRSADTFQLPALMLATPMGDEKHFSHSVKPIETMCLADMFPFGHGTIAHPNGIIIGEDLKQKPILYDSWHPRLNGPHMVILGQTNSGKGMTAKPLGFRGAITQGIQGCYIDPSFEYKIPMQEVGCPYFGLGPDSKDRINPFDVDIDVNPSTGQRFVNLDEAVLFAQGMVYKMIRITDSSALTGLVKIRVTEIIQDLYKSKGITANPNSIYDQGDGFQVELKRKTMPTLSELQKKMEEKAEELGDVKLAEAALYVKQFTVKGGSAARAVFDGQSTINIREAPLMAISLGQLDKEVMKPLGNYIVSRWLWERWVKKDPAQKKRLFVDECQNMLAEPEQAAWLEMIFREGRKYNVSVVAMSQGFEVFLQEDPETKKIPGMGILKNASTKIFLRQSPEDIDAVRGKFNVSEGEAQFLLTCPKGVGIVHADLEKAICHFYNTPLEYEWFSTDPNDQRGQWAQQMQEAQLLMKAGDAYDEVTNA